MSDYKDTLNLPKTEFSMRGNLPKKEPGFIDRWDSEKLYQKMLKKREGRELFILHDGPPYSNGHIHLGTALNKILKDFFVKYKHLKGFKTPYVPGWDNHGMPIENRVSREDPEIKELLKDKTALKKPEVKLKIREKCRESAKYWVEVQKKEFKRLGVLGDWENPYLTMSTDYESEELRILADLVEEGYIYRDLMTIHWCPTCQTALAMAEIEYKEKESPSVWFRMKIKEDKANLFDGDEGYALVWTTTPWTIVSNLALMFHPDFTYVVIEHEGTKYVLGEARLEAVLKEFGWEDVKIIKRLKGAQIEGTIFKHPFIDRESPAILAEFVTAEEGTGIVHTAPGHGKEDFEVGKKYGLPILSPVNERGEFTEEAGEPFVGLTIEEGGKKVLEIMEENGTLIKLGKIKHSYPHCWRCKNPLIFRATTQWFLSVDHNNLRQRALNEIKNVRWHPEEGENRIYASISERPDWVISRQRAWGVNIPALYCKKCGNVILEPRVIRIVADYFEKEGSDAWYKHPVEDFLPEDFKCPKCGGIEFEKEMDILDVWFDSGASNLTVLKESRGLRWPAELYLEGSDQHRGWFNASLTLGVAKRGRAPFKAVVTHGWVLDEQGRTMHKSLGNVIHPEEITEKYGADIMRLWVASTDYTEDVKLGKEILQRLVDSYRKIRNTYRFLLGNLYDFNPKDNALKYEDLLPLDKFMLHRLETLKREIDGYFDDFETHKVYHRYFNFVVVDVSAFYLDVLKDRLYTWGKDSKGRRSAQTVLYEILKTLLITFSPILSFTTEEAYQYLPGREEESVFLEDWPENHDEWLNEELASEFEKLLGVRDAVLVALEIARKEKKIISDRLEARVLVYVNKEDIRRVLEKYKDLLAELFIVSQVVIEEDKPEAEVVYENEGIAVGVTHAKGKKCARCWIWHEDVGKDPEYPDLCPKCIAVIKGNS